MLAYVVAEEIRKEIGFSKLFLFLSDNVAIRAALKTTTTGILTDANVRQPFQRNILGTRSMLSDLKERRDRATGIGTFNGK